MEPDPRLTGRENEILDLLREGGSTADIAAGLFIAPATVRNHINNIMTKTDTHSRIEAVAGTNRALDKGAATLAWCKSKGWQLSNLQRTLLLQVFLVTESGCDGGAHQWPPQVEGQPWTCLCGAMTAGTA